MKTISKFFAIAMAASLTLTACEEMLDLQPEGATKTNALKQDAYEKKPENAVADLNAIYAQMISLYAGLGSSNARHCDFGIASCMMLIESEGQDWIGPNTGYNWFALSDFYARNYNSAANLQVWNTYYKTIKACNDLIGTIDPATEVAMLRAYLGQALAVRAYCYTTMAQLYQYTYSATTKDLPCVPIVKDNMTAEEQLVGPRNTVQEVYDFVMNDLNNAISALEGYERPNKSAVNQAVAYGLRARANMLLGNYAEAAQDAAAAIQISGAKSYTKAEVSRPTFCHAEANSVIWANIIVESNDVVKTSIINWPSHMSSLYIDGYTGVGCYRSISSELYNKIPATDVRKGWWLDENLASPLLEGDNNPYSVWDKYEATPYVNVKFGVPNDNMSNLVADADWTLMRYEEMLLVQAEALARAGQEGEAKALLEGWVRENRNPEYSVGMSILEDIWMQRRIELWGEGFAWFDLNRLEKPIVRNYEGTNWPEAWVYEDIPASHPCRIWTIPDREIQNNPGIGEKDNNPVGEPEFPKPNPEQ